MFSGLFCVRLFPKQVLSSPSKLRILTVSLSTTSTLRNSPPPNRSNIGFIGTGKIAQSIIQAIIKKKLMKPENIYASDINKEYLAYLKDKSEVFQVVIYSFNLYYSISIE